MSTTTEELETLRRGLRAIVAQDAHVVGAELLDASVCGQCPRWAFAVARGEITREDVSLRCEAGQQWQADINAALRLI